jgi:hypothetical protein
MVEDLSHFEGYSKTCLASLELENWFLPPGQETSLGDGC